MRASASSFNTYTHSRSVPTTRTHKQKYVCIIHSKRIIIIIIIYASQITHLPRSRESIRSRSPLASVPGCAAATATVGRPGTYLYARYTTKTTTYLSSTYIHVVVFVFINFPFVLPASTCTRAHSFRWASRSDTRARPGSYNTTRDRCASIINLYTSPPV